MNFNKFKKNPIYFLKSFVLLIFLLYLFSDWANFKAGLFGKPPIEVIAGE